MLQRLLIAFTGIFLACTPAGAQEGMPSLSGRAAAMDSPGLSDAPDPGRVAVAEANVKFPPPEYSSDLISAYRRSLDTRRPMIVAFVPSWSNFSKQLIKEVLLAPSFRERFEGRGIFVGVDPDVDDGGGNVAKLIRELDIKRYPVVTVLDPRSTSIKERARIDGYFPLRTFADHLDRLLAMTPAAALGTR